MVRRSDGFCRTCGARTSPDATRCHDCWEVERRLAGYLRRGGVVARVFVQQALDDTRTIEEARGE